MNKKTSIIALILVTLTASAIGVKTFFAGGTPSNLNNAETKQVVIYKSPNCGCCIGHATYLKSREFSVDTQEVSDMSLIKEENNIPLNMQSCHTAMIDGYFIEGHVPTEAISKLLSKKPEIDGIALPGMPSGSPGMPGIKTGDFVVYALKDGEATEYMRL